MNFCPQCGALLQVVKKGTPSLRCPKCKYQKPLNKEETKQKINVQRGKSVEIAVIDKKVASLRLLPTVNVVCLTCGHTESETWNVETANETIHSTITFLRCTKCGTTKREAG
jgi:DNA-directed RNA polymerase subunit M/transcription elongation factor TFIIS